VRPIISSFVNVSSNGAAQLFSSSSAEGGSGADSTTKAWNSLRDDHALIV